MGETACPKSAVEMNKSANLGYLIAPNAQVWCAKLNASELFIATVNSLRKQSEIWKSQK